MARTLKAPKTQAPKLSVVTQVATDNHDTKQDVLSVSTPVEPTTLPEPKADLREQTAQVALTEEQIRDAVADAVKGIHEADEKAGRSQVEAFQTFARTVMAHKVDPEKVVDYACAVNPDLTGWLKKASPSDPKKLVVNSTGSRLKAVAKIAPKYDELVVACDQAIKTQAKGRPVNRVVTMQKMVSAVIRNDGNIPGNNTLGEAITFKDGGSAAKPATKAARTAAQLKTDLGKILGTLQDMAKKPGAGIAGLDTLQAAITALTVPADQEKPNTKQLAKQAVDQAKLIAEAQSLLKAGKVSEAIMMMGRSNLA
jgi:hypothetical protein